MYDPKQEPHEFVGEDRAAAEEKARMFFGLAAEQLLIQQLPAGEVYGLGGRTVIVAAPRDRKVVPRSDREFGGERRDRGRDRGRDRDGGRGRDRDGGRGGRGDRGGDRGGRGERGGDRGGRGHRDAPRGTSEAAAPIVRSEEPSVGTAQGALGEIGEFVKGAIERIEVGPFQIRESEDEGITVVEVQGAAAEALAAGDARAIDALQILANQALARTDEEGTRRVVLEVEGGSESREKHLERLAERVVQRAIEGGRAIALDPMNGRDRRTIHIAVREHEGVASMSIGEGRFRQVVVVPQGAPEYEEALRQSEG